MISLQTLTQRELTAVDAALTAIDSALETLLERGVCTEADGVDLEELSDAVAVELEQREAVA